MEPLTTLASVKDVEARLGRPLADDEKTRTDGLLEEASALVLGYCRRVEFNPVPEVVTIVVSRMVARTLTAPTSLEGVVSQQHGAGPFQQTLNYGTEGVSASPWLSKSDKIILSAFGGQSGTSVSVGSERS